MPKVKTKTKPKDKQSRKPTLPQPLPAAADALAPDDQVIASNQTLHELFQQQTTAMLESAEPFRRADGKYSRRHELSLLRSGELFIHGEAEKEVKAINRPSRISSPSAGEGTERPPM